MNNVLLWLDDYRDPFDEGKNWLRFSPVSIDDVTVIWVKNYDEFTKYIVDNGLPKVICFDHDLADEHYAPQHAWDDYTSWADKQNFKEKTGLDCANWLIDYCLDNNKDLPIFSSHSANPTGKENITKLLTNFLKFQLKNNI